MFSGVRLALPDLMNHQNRSGTIMTQAYQQRVIDEKQELDEKAKKLSDFIGNNPLFEKIDSEEQERMKEQCEVMWQYSEILGKRIEAFSKN